jgi:hypothetical protein
MYTNRINTFGNDPPALNHFYSTSDHPSSLGNDSSQHTLESDADSKSVQSTSTSASFYDLWKNEIESLKSRLDRQLQSMVAKSQHEIDVLSAAVTGQLQIQPSNEYEISSRTDIDKVVRHRSSQVRSRSSSKTRSSSVDSWTSKPITPLSKIPSLLSLEALRKQSVLSSVASAWTGNSIDDRPNSPRSMMRLKNQQNRWIKQRRMANQQQIEAAPKAKPVPAMIKRKPKPAPPPSLKPAASNMSVGNRSERTEPKSNLTRHVTARRIRRVLLPSQSNGSVVTASQPTSAAGAQSKNDTTNHIRSASNSEGTSFPAFSRAISPAPVPHSGSPINYPAPIDEEEDGGVTTDDEGVEIKQSDSFSKLNSSTSKPSRESFEVNRDAVIGQSIIPTLPYHTTNIQPPFQSQIIVVDQDSDIETSSAEMVLLSPPSGSRKQKHSNQELMELSRSSTPDSCMDPIMSTREETERVISILSGSDRANQHNSLREEEYFDRNGRILHRDDQEIFHVDEESSAEGDHDWIDAELNNRRDQAQYDTRLLTETGGGKKHNEDRYFDPVVERRQKSATPVTKEFLSIFARMDELRSSSTQRIRGADAPALSRDLSLKHTVRHRPDAPVGEDVSLVAEKSTPFNTSLEKIVRSESIDFDKTGYGSKSIRSRNQVSSRSFDDLILLSQYMSSSQRERSDSNHHVSDAEINLELVNSDLIDEILEGDDVEGLYSRLIESLNVPDDVDPSKKSKSISQSQRSKDEKPASQPRQSNDYRCLANARANGQYIDLTNRREIVLSTNQENNFDRSDEFRFIAVDEVNDTFATDKYAVTKRDKAIDTIKTNGFEGENEARQDGKFQTVREHNGITDDIRQAPEPRALSHENTVRSGGIAKRHKSSERHSNGQKKVTSKAINSKHAEVNENINIESNPEQVTNQTVSDHNGDFGKYTGALIRGKPYGTGTMTYGDGRTYTGEWVAGRWHGHGKCIFTNGDTYTGDYLKDQRHGIGRYEWNDGRVYDGSFVFDHRDGRGVYSWPDGSVYIGDFKKGLRHGHGLYTFAEGSVYTGNWENGKYHGDGECRWKDGRCYQGEWKEGTAHGYGVELKADGTVRHKGLWNKNKPVKQQPSKEKQKAYSKQNENSKKKVIKEKIKVATKPKISQTKQRSQQTIDQLKSHPRAANLTGPVAKTAEHEEIMTREAMPSAKKTQTEKIDQVRKEFSYGTDAVNRVGSERKESRGFIDCTSSNQAMQRIEHIHPTRQSPEVQDQQKYSTSNPSQRGRSLNRSTGPKTSDMYENDNVTIDYMPSKPDTSTRISSSSNAQNMKETVNYDMTTKLVHQHKNDYGVVSQEASQFPSEPGKEIVDGKHVIHSPSDYVIFLHGTRVDPATEQLWREFCATRQQQYDAIDARETTTTYVVAAAETPNQLRTSSHYYKHESKSASWEDEAELGIPSPNHKIQHSKPNFIPSQSNNRSTNQDSTIHAIENTQSKSIPIVVGEDLSTYYNNQNSQTTVVDANLVSTEEVENVVQYDDHLDKNGTSSTQRKYNNDQITQQRGRNSASRYGRGGNEHRQHDELFVIRD